MLRGVLCRAGLVWLLRMRAQTDVRQGVTWMSSSSAPTSLAATHSWNRRRRSSADISAGAGAGAGALYCACGGLFGVPFIEGGMLGSAGEGNWWLHGTLASGDKDVTIVHSYCTIW